MIEEENGLFYFDQKDFFDYFTDSFAKNVKIFGNSIANLQSSSKYHESVNTLFHIFHNLKANSQHLKLNEITVLAERVENVLSTLRKEKGPIEPPLVRWFVDVKIQMELWKNELESEVTPLSPVDAALLNSVQLGKPRETATSLLSQQSIVYLDENIERGRKLIHHLGKGFKTALHAHSLDEFEALLHYTKPTLCMLNAAQDNLKAATLISKVDPTIAIIAVFNPLEMPNRIILWQHRISQTILNPINNDSLKKALKEIVDTYFNTRNYILEESNIKTMATALQPIPESFNRIINKCNDNGVGMGALFNTISKDSAVLAYILEMSVSTAFSNATSPKEIIIQLGKEKIKAMVLKKMAEAISNVDFSPYKMNQSDFSKTSLLRMRLMLHWYSKISISELSVLAVTAVLGNIGQILITKHLTESGKAKDFIDTRAEKGVLFAEEYCVHTSTARISSEILKHWNLEAQIIDSVRYSDYPEEAPEDIFQLALANHIVYSLVNLDGTVLKRIPSSLAVLGEKYKLNLAYLQQALSLL